MSIQDMSTRLAAGLATALALVWAGQASAGIKCWTNKDGVRECGNAVPPEYVQKGHNELSRQGVTLRQTGRAKTQEELAAERAAREQAERERLEAASLASQQAEHDRVLLHTFTTERDLELSRDDKLSSIDSRIKHTKQVIIGLEKSLEELQGDAARFERSGKKVPDDLLRNIAGVEQRIDDNRASIDRRHTEKEELAAKFDADLTRYRQLKSAE
jgi:hypothetical protein